MDETAGMEAGRKADADRITDTTGVTSADPVTGSDPVTGAGRERSGDRVPWAVWVIAAVFIAVELAVSGRYGFLQDELYFIVAGHHLAFGYVDQPPLAPLLTRAVEPGDLVMVKGSRDSHAKALFEALSGLASRSGEAA